MQAGFIFFVLSLIYFGCAFAYRGQVIARNNYLRMASLFMLIAGCLLVGSWWPTR